ncbi:MAG: hypothetical protein HQ591_05020 [candidate division Zixibacteria bacterium]|nr:hypothetical protein [Candidatus Tariuqbacter arcticus]
MKYFFTFFLAFLAINLAFCAASSEPLVKNHDLELKFDLVEHSLNAVDEITIFPKERYFRFLLNQDFQVTKITVQGKKTKFKKTDEFDWNLFADEFESDDSSFFKRAVMYELRLKKKYLKSDSLKITVHYQGLLYDTVSVASFSRAQIADQTIGLIGEEGIYLSAESIYYPFVNDEMTIFSVTSYTPEGYLTVTDGRLAGLITQDGQVITRWEGEQPTDGIYFSGGKWNLTKDEYNGVEIYGFFFPEDEELAVKYVAATARYLKLYEGLIGKYPYSKFAVVENFFPTGYGMPSWTLLGREVLKLPWIIHSSFGHEICHNYWGNGVFVDYKKGNWCEGLTVYCADYLYKERKSAFDAREYRRIVNQDYTAYVNEGNDYPLTEFRERRETYTRAIGYGKAMMVVHMLKMLAGEENFWRALQDFFDTNLFKKASWEDIRTAFEKQTVEDLNWYFQQWVYRKGAPCLKLSDVKLEQHEGDYAIHLKVAQGEDVFRLKVPITVYYENAEATHWFEFNSSLEPVTIECGEKPSAVAVDPDFDVFRKLDRAEYPASLSEVLGAEKQVIILPSSAEEGKTQAYREMAETLNRSGAATILIDSVVKFEDLSQNSYFILGGPEENSLYETLESNGLNWSKWILFIGKNGNFMLKGQSFGGADCSYMITARNPLNVDESIAAFSANSVEEIKRTGRKLIHYGKYSYLAFESGNNKLKGSWEVMDSPLRCDFNR